MYITLKFGENTVTQMLVNPDCAVSNLLDFIRLQCNCSGHGSQESHLDVCDKDGRPRRLSDLPPMQSALSVLQHGEVYVPIIVLKNAENNVIKATPLLAQSDMLYTAIRKGLNQCLEQPAPGADPHQSPAAGRKARHHSLGTQQDLEPKRSTSPMVQRGKKQRAHRN